MPNNKHITSYINEFYPSTTDKVLLAGWSFANVSLLVSSIRSFRKGDYDKALYKVMLWRGLVANLNSADSIRLQAAERYKFDDLDNLLDSRKLRSVR